MGQEGKRKSPTSRISKTLKELRLEIRMRGFKKSQIPGFHSFYLNNTPFERVLPGGILSATQKKKRKGERENEREKNAQNFFYACSISLRERTFLSRVFFTFSTHLTHIIGNGQKRISCDDSCSYACV